MRNLEFSGQIFGKRAVLTQVSKPAAKKLYESGEDIYLCPCKMRPLGVWGIGMAANKAKSEDAEFDALVNSFSFYNCTSEMGRYVTFYKIIYS